MPGARFHVPDDFPTHQHADAATAIAALLSAEPADIARQLSRLPKGTVTYLYCITGSSVPQPALHEMVAALEPHVQVVGHQQLASLARQRAAAALPFCHP